MISRLASGLAALVVLAGPVLATPASTQDTIPRQPATITLKGSASAAVVPDTAILSLGVVTVRPKASDAVDDNSKAMAAVIAELKAEAVPAEAIQTTSLELTPVTDDRAPGKPRVAGYQARNGLVVRVDAKTVGRILAQLIDRGANTVDDLSFANSDEAATRDRLKGDAAKDARRRAEIYASALGLRLGRVREVHLGSSEAEPSAAARVMRRKVASVPVPVEAGQRDLTEQVTVTFELLQ